MEDRVIPRSLEEWVTFARDVLDLRDGEAEAYAIVRRVEDENREVLSARTAAGGADAAPARDSLDR
jgi:hypothetical protein